jgi:hypothetical protein
MAFDTAFLLEAFDTLLSFWMASTTASTAEVQNAAATPKEVQRDQAGVCFYWMPCLESTPSTRHVLALFNTIDSAWVYSTPSAQCCLALFNAFDTAQLGVLVNDYNMACTAFDMAWLGLFDAFDAARRGFDWRLPHSDVDPFIFCYRNNNPPAANNTSQAISQEQQERRSCF